VPTIHILTDLLKRRRTPDKTRIFTLGHYIQRH